MRPASDNAHDSEKWTPVFGKNHAQAIGVSAVFRPKASRLPHAIRGFRPRHGRKSPERLELEDVRAFQVHLVSTGVSWPGLNQIVCALRFFYGVTLGEADVPERIPYAREPVSCRSC